VPAIDSKTTSNAYTDACTIEGIWGSNGGFFSVIQADVFAELQWGIQGQGEWTDEVHVPVGPGQIFPGTSGIKFRSYVAGTPAIVSASIAYPRQPTLLITASGTVTIATPSVITGITTAAGGIVAGTGFAVAHPGTGVYNVTYTTSFSSAPVTEVTARDSSIVAAVSNVTATGLTIRMFDSATQAPIDNGFHFLSTAIQ
jgi:hypothetical protein